MSKGKRTDKSDNKYMVDTNVFLAQNMNRMFADTVKLSDEFFVELKHYGAKSVVEHIIPLSFISYSDDVLTQLPEAVPTSPPRQARLLLWFVCRREDREAVLGDLAEDYAKCVKEHGERAARFWYWSQAGRSVLSLVWPALRRALAIEILLRKFGL